MPDPMFSPIDSTGAFTVAKTVEWLSNNYQNGVSAKKFGAKGDGTTDDTTALQAWLTDSSKVKYLPEGTYIINTGLTCSVNDVIIYGPGTLKANTAELIMLTISGHRATVDSLRIEGNNLGRYGLRMTGMEPVVQHCVLQNLRSTTSTARGIDTNTTTKIIVRDNIIRNVVAVGNASQGDNNGMTRAIVIYSPDNSTEHSVCSGNWIDNVGGEEGDGIAVLSSNGVSDADPYEQGWVKVSDNIVRNCGRRHIKIQGSDAWVDGNWCYNTPTYTVTNPSNVIDVIQGHRVRITNNTVKEVSMGAPISIAGPSTTDRIIDIEISGNHLTEGDNANPVIYLAHTNNVVIKDNILVGGTNYVSAGTSDDLRISNNICRDGVSANVAFSFTASANGFIRGNIIPTGRPLGSFSTFIYGDPVVNATLVRAPFVVKHNGSAWDFPTLADAQNAGLNTAQTVWFIGNPGGSLPGWQRAGDVWTQE